MDINKEKRIELFKKAPEIVRDLYGSNETGRLIWNLEKKFNINTEEDSTNFSIAIGDIILGLYKKEHFNQLLKSRMTLSEEQIKIAETELVPLFNKIPESDSVSTSSIIPTQPPGPSSDQPESTSVENAEKINTIQPLRTFAMDVDISRAHSYGSFQSGEVEEKKDNEPVHRSSQDDIIKK